MRAADDPRACAGAPYKAHGGGRLSEPVNGRAIVNDRWTSNGQHVLHTTERRPACARRRIHVYSSAAAARRGRRQNSALASRIIGCYRGESAERDNAERERRVAARAPRNVDFVLRASACAHKRLLFKNAFMTNVCLFTLLAFSCRFTVRRAYRVRAFCCVPWLRALLKSGLLLNNAVFRKRTLCCGFFFQYALQRGA